ncbi:MAG: hypothetical protein ACXU60_05465 [Croceibacterium sp.]
MPNVVVAGGLIQCSHQGIVKLSGGDARLAIAGAAALTAGMEAGLSFAIGAPGVVTPCPLPAPSGPPSSSACNATFAATAGLSSQLTIGDLGVLLDTASGRAANANDVNATWSIAQAGQTIVSIDR